jgi:hypothetical protein
MLLEFMALIGIIILALIFITESTRMMGLGLIAGALFLFLAYWVYGDISSHGIQVNIGYNQTTTQNSTYDNVTNQTITTSVQNMVPMYAPLPATPFVDMTSILAFCFMLCGLYTIVHYSMDIVNNK